MLTFSTGTGVLDIIFYCLFAAAAVLLVIDFCLMVKISKVIHQRVEVTDEKARAIQKRFRYVNIALLVLIAALPAYFYFVLQKTVFSFENLKGVFSVFATYCFFPLIAWVFIGFQYKKYISRLDASIE